MKDKALQIFETSDYSRFVSNAENRQVKLNGAKRKKLRKSMQLYGFLRSFPLSCVRWKNGKLWVKDGQHRLAVARELGTSIFYVIDEVEYDIALVNDGGQGWNISDYANSFSSRGHGDYTELLEFSERHGIPLSTCIGILANNSHERNVLHSFKNGTFKIRSRDIADRVAKLYREIGAVNKRVMSRFFVCALFPVCLVPGVDDDRLIAGAKRCPEQLIRYGSKDGYIQMLEDIYNYGRRTKYPLKIEAENALHRRNPANRTETEELAA